jgi:hypothetical protein
MNRPDEAQSQLALASRSLGDGFHLPHVQAAVAHINIELYLGHGSVATRLLHETWPNIEQIGVTRLQQPRIELNLLRARTALADLGYPDRLRVARVLADEMVKEATTWGAGLGHFVRAAVYAWNDDPDGALDELSLADDDLAASGMVGLLHIVRMRRGYLEGGAGGVARAEAARDILRDLGAVDPDRVAAHMVPWPS